MAYGRNLRRFLSLNLDLGFIGILLLLPIVVGVILQIMRWIQDPLFSMKVRSPMFLILSLLVFSLLVTVAPIIGLASFRPAGQIAVIMALGTWSGLFWWMLSMFAHIGLTPITVMLAAVGGIYLVAALWMFLPTVRRRYWLSSAPTKDLKSSKS